MAVDLTQFERVLDLFTKLIEVLVNITKAGDSDKEEKKEEPPTS